SRFRISFGSHSSTHRILTNLTGKEIQDETEGSRRTLLERQVNDIPVFCYPNGNYSGEVARYVKDAGYQAAATTSFGLEGEFPGDLFGLKRVGVHNDVCATIPSFSFRISGLNHLTSLIS